MNCTFRSQEDGTIRSGSVSLYNGSPRGFPLAPIVGERPRDFRASPGAAGCAKRAESDSPDDLHLPAQASRIDASLSRSLSERLKPLAERIDSVATHLSVMSPHDVEAVLIETVEALILLTRSVRFDKVAPRNSRQISIRLVVERFVEAGLSSRTMTPDTIASDLDIPRATLCRAFTDVGGLATYIQHRRLAIARSLLLNPEECRPISEIASSLGFDSNAVFSKAFRKLYGCTPRGMRQLGGNFAQILRLKDGAVRGA